MFQKGNKLGKGGKIGHKGGGGRPKEEFLQWCRELSSSPEARAFISALVKGEPIEEKIIDTVGCGPRKIFVSASSETRRRALADIWDRGYGKAPQATDEEGNEIPMKVEVVSYLKK